MKRFFLVIAILFAIKCGSDNEDTGDKTETPQLYTLTEKQEFFQHFQSVETDFAEPYRSLTSDEATRDMERLTLAWYQVWGQMIEAKIDKSDSAFLTKQKRAIGVLKKYQSKMFPVYRKSFGQKASKMLWEADCEAAVSGGGNDELILSGNYFLPNRNKAKTKEALHDMLRKFRFKKLTFKWYAGDSDSFSYDIKSDNDEASL